MPKFVWIRSRPETTKKPAEISLVLNDRFWFESLLTPLLNGTKAEEEIYSRICESLKSYRNTRLKTNQQQNAAEMIPLLVFLDSFHVKDCLPKANLMRKTTRSNKVYKNFLKSKKTMGSISEDIGFLKRCNMCEVTPKIHTITMSTVLLNAGKQRNKRARGVILQSIKSLVKG